MLEVVAAFEKATVIEIPFEIGPRREGDAEAVYADCTKAESDLNWKTSRSIDTAMIDLWKWQKAKKS